VYRIKGKEATQEHLQQVGQLIQSLLEELASSYRDQPAYQVLQRFFEDNYRLEDQSVQTKANRELKAGCLQSCDDLEASFRRKGQREYKGYVANLTETCDPKNEVQLITKIQVAPNNVNDADLLVEALPDLKERTGLETIYTDGAFTGPVVDPVLLAQGVEQIQTGIKGVVPDPEKLNLSDFEIQLNEQGRPERITCPQGQSVAVEETSRKRSFRADFDPAICQNCRFFTDLLCLARPKKRKPVFRLTFLPSEWPVAQRRRKFRQHQQSGKNQRAAIEGTVREVKHPYPTGKLPVRGLFRVTCVLVGSAAMTNVRRIHHYWEAKRKKAPQESQDLPLFSLLETSFRVWSTFRASWKPCFGF
jgi:hypothetical protein